MRDSEQRSAQTDNINVCVMYCQSTISGKLFVTLSLSTFHQIVQSCLAVHQDDLIPQFKIYC